MMRVTCIVSKVAYVIFKLFTVPHINFIPCLPYFFATYKYPKFLTSGKMPLSVPFRALAVSLVALYPQLKQLLTLFHTLVRIYNSCATVLITFEALSYDSTIWLSPAGGMSVVKSWDGVNYKHQLATLEHSKVIDRLMAYI
ncbi:hypothetical protein DFP73DRAFT_525408 [Morchella snyderi]|nr:hypothetical protein DFP73DRAFT_525408 [Morchella snyderi]